MSFGLAVGDVIQVGTLAWKLYRDCYKVARDAPQEFQLLVAEMSTMSNSLGMLQEEIKDPESTLLQAGEERVELVKTVVVNIHLTLQSLEEYATKFEISGPYKSTTRLQLRQKVKNFKWSLHRKSIEELRSKMHQHNGLITLLLTSAGNSSLQRIQNSTSALEEDVAVIRTYVSEQQGGQDILAPSLSVVDDELLRSSISATLLRHAEVSQPWTTIGVTQWIDTGRWWLQGCELELDALAANDVQIDTSTYASLLKASWILVDIIACHPQVSFITAKTRAEISNLCIGIKSDFERIQKRELSVPDLTEMQDKDLRIWEDQVKAPTLRRHGTFLSKNQLSEHFWAVEGDGVALFVQRAICRRIGARDSPVVVDVLFLLEQNGRSARLLANAQAQVAAVDIHFNRRVESDYDSEAVYVNGEVMIFKGLDKIHVLAALIETANFWFFERNQSYHNVDAFKAYFHIVSIKNKFQPSPQTIVPSVMSVSKSPDSSIVQKVVSTAAKLFEESADGTLKQRLYDGRERPRRNVCLYSWAVQTGQAKLLELLLEEDARWIPDPENDFSPLMMAGYCNHEASAKVLLDHAAKSSTLKEALAAKKKDGWSALHYACSHSDEKIVRLFLRSKAEINAPGHNDWTPLHCAAHHDKGPVVQLLLDKGAKGEAKDRQGLTPLLVACKDNSEAAIEILLAEDVNVKAEDDCGSTALHWALESYQTKRKRYVSRPVFVDLFYSYWPENSIHRPGQPFKRDIITYEMNSDWIHLFLYTPHARFILPDGCPPHVEDIYDRMLEFHKPPGAEKFFKFKVTLHVIHQGSSLSFATSHGSLNTERRAASTKLQIENGGEFTSRPTGDGRNFCRHLNLKTDPNAQVVDLDDTPMARETVKQK